LITEADGQHAFPSVTAQKTASFSLSFRPQPQSWKNGERMKRRTKAELLVWIEQHQPVTREKLLGAFEDMDYEQLQGWLSELQRKRRLFEVNPETYYTTIEPPEYQRG
jgi:hypothetical protein